MSWLAALLFLLVGSFVFSSILVFDRLHPDCQLDCQELRGHARSAGCKSWSTGTVAMAGAAEGVWLDFDSIQPIASDCGRYTQLMHSHHLLAC